MSQLNNPEPWYAPSGKRKPIASSAVPTVPDSAPRAVRILISVFLQLKRIRGLIFAGAVASVFSFFAARMIAVGSPPVLGGLLASIGLLISFLLVLRFLGSELSRLLPLHSGDSAFAVAMIWMRGGLKVDEGRRGPPAPELALSQFVSQVRAYATEKSFQNVKPLADRSPVEAGGAAVSESANLLKRRWNEVVDSLDEFEIYLANDPQGMISKLVSKNPPKQLDAAVVFREVADSFDTTWRRKGINIESAIVTPLKATAQEGLLRRLLVGPWRASAYFARRGASVVFSAKSVQGRVVARWEVDGLSIPDDYLALATNSTTAVNERIEKGLQAMAPEPANSPNTLYALISLITWIDLAHACETEFEFKNNNNGFVIEIRLK
ncbi:MAG: hypothetical protein ACO3A4_07000 [Silvanigrellaceae bacterium]